ncbi:MAG TPA: hypothetical protein PLT75_19625, partial [Spirochaetota bacterium]|nr:hypothetical protein [Spirochaetota bacterium]
LGITANVICMALFFHGAAWWFLLGLIPYALIFPIAASVVVKHHSNPDKLKRAAKMTVMIHMLFSLLLITGFILYLLQ